MSRSVHFFILTLWACASLVSYAQDKTIGLNTVVIDAGHGGKDPGCLSPDKKIYEKDLTLKISTMLAEKIRRAHPQVKVVCTRETDAYLTLNERAETANNNNANLFISIHINANGSSAPRGYSSHILGQSSKKGNDLFSNNMDVCKRENSVILLEDDYTTKYEGFDPSNPESFIFFNLMQNAYYEQSLLFAATVNEKLAKSPLDTDRGIFQDPFYVLWKTTMPAVLIELGFISNAHDRKILSDDDCLNHIAERLLYAFNDFKQEYDKSMSVETKAPVATANPTDTKAVEKKKDEPAPATAGNTVQTEKAVTEPVKPSKVRYGIQILASSKSMSPADKFFKGHEVKIYKVKNLYKYILEETQDESQAVENLKKISKEYNGAFIVKITDEIPQIYRK